MRLSAPARCERLAVAIAAAGIAAFGASGCSHTITLTPSSAATLAAATPPGATPAAEPGVTSYLCAFSDGDMLLQWNSANGYLSGTYQDASISGTAPQEQVNTTQGNLSGTTSGSGGITLNIGTATWYGTIAGSTATLNVPQNDGSIQPVTCNQAGVSDWNSAVAQLNGQVTTDNNTTQQAQASQSAAAAQAQQVSNAQAGNGDAAAHRRRRFDTVGGDARHAQRGSRLKPGTSRRAADLSNVKTDLSTLQTGVAPAGSARRSLTETRRLTNAANAISGSGTRKVPH